MDKNSRSDSSSKDHKQIAFIICTNNEQYYNQCMRYIQDLEVPQGYHIDVICVQEAESMASGYHAAMQSSMAKYKVYLHHDTFIINRRFLYDMLQVFEQDSAIGMMGMIGVMQLPGDADCYMKWNTGRVLACDASVTYDNTLYQDAGGSSVKVGAVDGLLIATQYDLPWREDVFDGWDFYDVSHSLEMYRKGYSVVVPYQKEIWCYHDCGASKLKEYHLYRMRAVQEYKEYFDMDMEKAVLDNEKNRKAHHAWSQIKEKLIYMYELKLYDELQQILMENNFKHVNDTEIRELSNVLDIYAEEKKRYGKTITDLFGRMWKDTQREYRQMKFEMLYSLRGCNMTNEKIIKQMTEKGMSEEAVGIILKIIS